MFLEVAWEGTGQLTARTSDISLAGCFVDSVTRIGEGETLRFKLRMPDGEWIQLQAIVAYTYPNIGFGLRFTEISEEALTKLKQLIEK